MMRTDDSLWEIKKFAEVGTITINEKVEHQTVVGKMVTGALVTTLKCLTVALLVAIIMFVRPGEMLMMLKMFVVLLLSEVVLLKMFGGKKVDSNAVSVAITGDSLIIFKRIKESANKIKHKYYIFDRSDIKSIEYDSVANHLDVYGKCKKTVVLYKCTGDANGNGESKEMVKDKSGCYSRDGEICHIELYKEQPNWVVFKDRLKNVLGFDIVPAN